MNPYCSSKCSEIPARFRVDIFENGPDGCDTSETRRIPRKAAISLQGKASWLAFGSFFDQSGKFFDLLRFFHHGQGKNGRGVGLFNLCLELRSQIKELLNVLFDLF